MQHGTSVRAAFRRARLLLQRPPFGIVLHFTIRQRRGSRKVSQLKVRLEGSLVIRHYKVIVPAAILDGRRMSAGWANRCGRHTLQAQFEARNFVLDIDR